MGIEKTTGSPPPPKLPRPASEPGAPPAPVPAPAPAARDIAPPEPSAVTAARERITGAVSSFVESAATAATHVATQAQGRYESTLVERQDVAMARQELDAFDTELRGAAAAGLVSESMLRHLEGIRNEPITGNEAASALQGARDAAERTGALSEQLHATLEHLTPVTTDAERAAMTEQFQEMHADTYTAQGEANRALSESLTTLATTAFTPGDAQTMVEGLQHLATDPTYTEFVAEQTASLLNQTQRPPWAGQLEALAGITVDVATARALEAGADPTAVQSALDSAARALTAVGVATTGPTAGRQLLETRALVDSLGAALSSGEPNAAQNWLRQNADAISGLSSSESPLEQSLGRMTATLGVVKTFAELGSYALSERADGDLPRLAAALGAGGSLAEVTALGLTQVSGQMQRAAQAGLMSAGAAENLASRLSSVGTGLAKVGGVLGAGGAVLGTFIAAGEAWKNPSVGTVGAALGSAVSAAGTVATLLGANTVGGPLVWAGTAIGLGAWAYQAASDNRTYLREGAQLLTPHVGGDAAMAQALMSTSRLAELGAAGLSAQQIRDGVARLEGEAPGMASLAAQIIQRSGAPADEAAAFLAQASPEWIQSIAAQLTPGLGSVSTGSPEELRRAMADAVRAAQ